MFKMPKTRKERRRSAGEAFRSGKARRTHVNKSDVRKSFEEAVSSTETSERPGPSFSDLATPPTSNVCPQCAPILTRYDCLV